MRWKSAAILLAAALLAAAAAQEPLHPAPTPISSALPAVLPSGRAAVGVALEGGGALGLAHIGVLQWFEEHHIPVDRLSGTSMGALVGALYATGSTPAQMRALATSDAFTRVFTLQSPYTDLSFRRRQDRRELPQALTVGLSHHFTLRNALLSDRGVNEFLTGNMAAYNSQELDYDRFPIPFRCVATDLNTLQTVIFASGPLPQAVRASISIPGVFSPVQDRSGHYLVDGGILDNLPTGVLQRDFHADVIIAVRLEDAPLANADTMSIVGVLNRAFDAGIERNAALSEQLANIVVRVPTGGFSTTDYARAALLIDAGYKAAQRSRADLLRYALDDAGWQAYLTAREGRRRPAPGLLHQVHVEGGTPGAVREVLADHKPTDGQPIAPATTQDALRRVQSNGGISATWETFAPPAAPTAPSPSASVEPAPDTSVMIAMVRPIC
ncbi:MAG: patatin-like phospholipase family protein [Terracidiphilus sp.]